MNAFGHLLPIDGYHVLQQGSLPKGYSISLTHLYQPLVGLTAVMLYQTLLHEKALQVDDQLQTHHTLMNYMALPLDEIYRARKKLEGIGLLKTYKQPTTDHDCYTYCLQSPFSPMEFFKDDMLQQLLYHHIGEDKFAQLKESYVQPDVTQSLEEVTASFQDVFHTFQLQSADVEPIDHVPEQQMKQMDLSWMRQALRQQEIPEEKVLTNENKKLIEQMMVLYDLAEFEVEKAVMWSLTMENNLEVDEFKTACHDLFYSRHQESVIKLTDRMQQPEEKAVQEKAVTREDQLIQALETISPKQLLEDLSSGNHASGQDLKLIRDVMATQGLTAPVMNVLIHYVLLQTNMKLSRAYLEKIASHWSRANLQTAKEAMAFAKQEKGKYQKGNTKNGTAKRSYSKEVVPDWFKERKKDKQTNPKPTEHHETEEEKEEFDALLREFTHKNNHLQG